MQALSSSYHLDDASSSEEGEFENDNVSVVEGMEEFVDPDAGTPAAQALQANAALKVTKYHKYVARHIKRPTLKKIIRNIKPRNRQKKSFQGKKIDGLHELYTLTLGMMLGIRAASGRQHHFQQNNHIDASDFTRVDKYVFPPKGSSGPLPTPPHSLAHTFKFKNYCPAVFRALRHMYGVDTGSYMMSVCGNANFIEFIPNSKSGQFFFYSHDRKYVIKTQTPEEKQFLLRILPQYYEYLKQNPHSFLVRFFGMHRVKMYHLRRKVHFVIMSCVFDPDKMQVMYDLKGSTLGRRTRKPVSAKEIEEVSEYMTTYSHTRQESIGPGLLRRLNSLSFRHNTQESKEDTSSSQQRTSAETPDMVQTADDGRLEVLKDLDFLADSTVLHLGRSKEAIINQLRKDVEFLASLGIMDYSLLLGIRNTADEDVPNIMHSLSSSSFAGDDLPLRRRPSGDEPHHQPRDSEDLPMLGSSPLMTRPVSARQRHVDFAVDVPLPEGVVVGLAAVGQPSSRHLRADRMASNQDASYRRERRRENCPWKFREDNGIVAEIDGETGSEIYYMGIIDILTHYNQLKRLETAVKSIQHSRSEISAVPPAQYQSRFIDFFSNHVA